jgi:cytochrome P450
MSTFDDLPGPRGVPVFGNLPQYSRGRESHRVLARWCDQYGPTYRIRLGPARAVVTADPRITEVVLRDRPTDFRRATVMTRAIDEIVGAGVFSAEGDQWRRLRTIATRSLSAAYLRDYFTTVERVTGRLHRRWSASAGTPVDVLDDVMRYTLDVTVGLAMGHDLHALEHQGTGLHTRLREVFPILDRRLNAAFPYWRYFRLPADRRLDATVAEVDELVRAHAEKARRRTAAGGQPSNFLEALVVPVDGEPPVTHRELVGNVLTMLLAGEDTTSALISWTLHHLARDPAEQEKVRTEAAEVLGGAPVATDPLTVRRLRHAEAAVTEAMRLHPPAPYLFLQAVQPVTLSGTLGRLTVDPDTLLIVLLGYGARHDHTRFPEPGMFRPHRWLDGVPPALPDAAAYLPFGSGPRFCPGRNLALMEATMAVSMACHGFGIMPDSSAGPVREQTSFSVFPENLRLRFTRRTPPGPEPGGV